MCGDIWTYLHDTDGRVFMYWVYKRMFTPLEQEKKYIDESQFEDAEANRGVITECVELPDGDLLLGFQNVDEDGEPTTGIFRMIGYYKLSEIRLAYIPPRADEDDMDE